MKALLPLLAAALLLPLAHAQPPSAQGPAVPGEAGIRLLEDAAGDVKASLSGQQQDPSGRFAATDLKALEVLETPDDFTFTLRVGSLKASPEVPLAESTGYAITFLHKDRAFSISIFRQVLEGATYGAYLQVYDPALDRYDQLSPYAPVQVNADAGTMAVSYGRDLLLDHDGNTPHPEVPLTSWRVVADSGFSFGSDRSCFTKDVCTGSPGASAHDAMPDAGNGTLDLAVRYGIVQSGKARLASEIPTRASNGEATTIVYQVEASSGLAGNQSFLLAASGLPAGWEVKLPGERITVPGNASILFPVVVTVPFAHQHGTYQKFLLEMKAVRDSGSIGRVQLGIRYTQPPQPAGHHNVLWLHSQTLTSGQSITAFDTLFGTPASGLYMNAASPEEDTYDAKAEVPGEQVSQDLVPPLATYLWSVPLAPALEMGLDFKQTIGNVSVPLKTTLPMPGATLGGRLVYVPPGATVARGFDPSLLNAGEAILADLTPDAPVDVAANTQGNFLHATLVPRPETGYIPFEKGAGLRLDLMVTFTRLDGLGGGFGPRAAPVVQPGGILDLPLNEYHDKVAQVFASNATLALEAQSAQDRVANPGKMVLYNLTLANRASQPVTVNLELTGTHILWVSLLEPTQRSVRLAPNETRAVKVAVKVPLEADRGDTADVVLAATSASDLNVRSLARLYTTVDTGREYRDDSALIAAIEGTHAKKKTPGPETPLVGLGLVAVAFAARRRFP
ncbi:MAG TPA: FixG Ig-like domain-containing protein [Candidatus Thermoplasmatota archaeon]|nr:FixG Ig-like domain-containing protein [Candidatus Thermoplasmatota archaeon]